ncbi:MAG: hypothetical protein ACO39X_04965 [Candidatus Nanopelagicaceae bacterium]
MSDYPDSGVLFKNDYKTDEKHPDYKGKGEYKGVTFDLAAWVRQGKSGSFLSIKFSKPFEKNKQEPQDRREAPNMMKQADALYGGSDDGDLPF